MKKYPESRIALLAIIACLLWASAFVGVKIGLKYSKPLSFAGIRFMLSGIILFPFAGGFRKYFRSVAENFQVILITGLLQTFLLYYLFYTGMTLLSGALAAIIIGSSPMTTSIVAHFSMHDDEMNLPKMLFLLLGIFGIIIIALSRQPWSSSAGLSEFIGIIILILSTICSAFANIFVAKNKKDINPLILNSAQIFLGGLLLLLISLPLEGLPGFNYPMQYYFALFWLAMLSAIAFSIWFTLLRKPGVKVSALNVWKFIIPVFGAIFSWLILPGEKPELYPLIGMLCVALSIVIYNLYLLKNKEST